MNISIGKMYIRSIIAIVAIGIMMCYLQAADQIPEAMAAILGVVYIDRTLSKE